MRARGFTLPEMLVVMVIVAVTVMIAVPSFTGLMARSALTSKLNELVGAMQLARSSAITRQARVAMCVRNADQTETCDASGTWVNGWVVFVDADTDGVVDTGEAVLGSGLATTDFQFKNTISTFPRLSFKPDGSANGVGTTTKLTVCKGNKQYEGEIVLDATGRPTSKRLNSIVNC